MKSLDGPGVRGGTSPADAAPDEIAAIREWLKREGTCLLLAPHHDVGFTDDLKQRFSHTGEASIG
jgi:hypothetical protein